MTTKDCDGGQAHRHSTAGSHLAADDTLWHALVCPYCRGPLSRRPDGAVCVDCGDEYPLADSDTLDLRPQQPKSVKQTVELDDAPRYPDLPFETTAGSADPDVDFSSLSLPRRLPRELAAHIPAATDTDSLALDLGCGNGIHREVCEAADYRWVGLDVDPMAATVVGDGQALPFADNTFECILSLKVASQVQNPFVMFSEAQRVLEPGGVFVGNVASGEPFFGSNTFKMTPVGLHEVLRQGGLTTERIFPGWDALTAQAMMGRFPLLPRQLSKAAVAPLKVASLLWYRLGSLVVDHEKTSETYRRLNAAAELHFVARAPEEGNQGSTTAVPTSSRESDDERTDAREHRH